jgi:hypothetical protein
MVTQQIALTVSVIPTIGETAGRIWRALEDGGEVRLASLKRKLEVPSALLQMALGWLAREDKIEITPEEKSYRIRLR